MKRIIFVTIIYLMSFNVQAEWVMLSETKEKGVTPFGVKSILGNYDYESLFHWEKQEAMNKMLAGMVVDPIREVEVTTRNMKWEGETTCEPEDPRLYHTTYETYLCYESKGSYGPCWGMAEIMFPHDPCSFDYSKAKPKVERTALPSKK